MRKGWVIYPDYIKEAEVAIGAYSGGDFIDVGMAKEVYLLFLAPKAKNARFLLLEPNPIFVKPMIATVQAAMENHASFIPYIIPAGAGAEKRRRVEFNTNGRIFHADIIKIDDLVKSFRLEPGLVKIDVDGPEFFVLEDMKETTKHFRPSILLEMHYLC
jgi:FkbM family methyltransferase